MDHEMGISDTIPGSMNYLPTPDYLQESNILNLIPEAVCVCDMSGIIQKYNEQAVHLWGRRPVLGDKEERFTGAWKLYYPDGMLLPRDQTPAAACIKDGLPRKNVEVVIERPDGSRVHVQMNVIPIKDDAGVQVGIINCLYDITEKKETEKKLLSKTEELKDYVENASVALHWVDGNGIIKWANQAELDMLGYKKEEYIGRHIAEFHVSREKIEDILYKLSCNEVLNQYESQLYCKDGTIKTVHISSNVFWEDGKFVHTRCFTQDITGIKKAEKALQDSEAKYRKLANILEIEVEKKVQDLRRKSEDLKKSEERYHKMVEEVEDYAILMLDRNGIIQNWNKGAEKIKGYKEAEIVGKSFEEFYLPADRANNLPINLLNLARETGKAIHEGWRKRKDGTAFWGSIVLTALHDDDNNLIGFSKVTRDLTERKITEDKLNEYLSQLEFQNSELEQFVYAASHDLKEPLRKIHFYSDYIASDPGNQLSPKSVDYLSRSMNAVERMKRLIEDLLSYSRSTSNVESHKTVNLNEVLEDVIHMQKEEMERKIGKIERDALPVIRAVPFQVKQLFFNLINNAVKYKHPDREVQIHVKYELVNAGDIQEYKIEPGIQYHKISVIDNGVGFDARYANKIFEIFQRLNNTADASGSGIGLAICKKIVQNHKGFIHATGKPGKGANFSIYLPVAV
jgi:PAS domain S-box-containing protein